MKKKRRERKRDRKESKTNESTVRESEREIFTDAVLSEGGVDGQHGDVARQRVVVQLPLGFAHNRPHGALSSFRLKQKLAEEYIRMCAMNVSTLFDSSFSTTFQLGVDALTL